MDIDTTKEPICTTTKLSYYVKIGDFWIVDLYKSLGKIQLGMAQTEALPLTEEICNWIKEKIPSAKTFAVRVTVDEFEVDWMEGE